MNRHARGFRRSAVVALLAAAATLASTIALAGPVAFGARTLDIPAPGGFVPVREDIPAYILVAEGYLPQTNRLVEAYVEPADKAAMLANEPRPLKRYFQVQTLRGVDGKPLSSAEFAGALGTIEAQIAALVPKLDKEGARLAAQGNEALHANTDSEAEVSLGGPTYHGVFRRESWGLFFTASMPVTISDGGATVTARLVGATALVLVDHQLLYLYAYGDESEPGARAWAERSLSAWADAVRAANPDGPAVAGSR